MRGDRYWACIGPSVQAGVLGKGSRARVGELVCHEQHTAEGAR